MTILDRVCYLNSNSGIVQKINNSNSGIVQKINSPILNGTQPSLVFKMYFLNRSLLAKCMKVYGSLFLPHMNTF